MSDDNVVDFGKALKETKSNNAQSIEERVIQCMTNDDCECMYCNYKATAAEMVIDFLSRDMLNFETNLGGQCCTYDLKDIFFKAILKIKELEKSNNESKEDE